MAKKQIEDRAEDLGKEVGGFLFRQAFGALSDAITDTFGTSSSEPEEPKPKPKVKKKKVVNNG